jgi:hypothetical protein
MRYKRTMDKPAGLLTILRRAIMEEDANAAATIARKCSEHKGIYFSMYCDFMLRILLEDKYPEGKKYFSALKKERENFKKGVLSNRNKDVRLKDHKYADIAHAIAKLKTNHEPFEQAFYLLYNYVYDHKYCDPAVVDSDGQYNSLGHPSLKQRTFDGTPLINDVKAVWTTVNNDYAGDKLTRRNKTTEINDLQKDCWSNDHVLRELYFSRSNNVTVAAAHDFPTGTYPGSISEAFANLDVRLKTEYGDAFKKRSRDDEGADKMLEYLYPKATDTVRRFKYSMGLYLKNEGHTHYVGTTQNKRVSVLQHLRYLARCKKSRPREVTLDTKKYGLNYLQFDSSCWTVQLVAHPGVEATEDVSDYPYLLKTFKVLYPETRVDGTTFNDSSEKDIGTHAKVEQLFTISPKNRNIFKMEANQPKKKLFQFKHLNGADGDDKCLAFLQVLIYRYKHNYRTTLKDIRYEEKGESFTMYSLSNNGKKKPNRRHPDIWHQLFYGIQKRAAQTVNLSYVVRIIDRLQKFIHDKGHKDQDGQPYAFFKWLEEFDSSYVSEFGNAAETIPGLWYRLVDSLDKKERTLKNKYGHTIKAPRTMKKLTIYDELQFIEDEFARETV